MNWVTRYFGTEQRRWPRYSIFFIVLTVAFSFGLYAGFPTDAVKHWLELEFSQEKSPTTPMAQGMMTTLETVSPHMFFSPGIEIEGLKVSPFPQQESTPPMPQLSIDKVNVQTSWTTLLKKDSPFVLDAKVNVAGGQFLLQAFPSSDGKQTDLKLESSPIDLSALSQFFGFPLYGKLEITPALLAVKLDKGFKASTLSGDIAIIVRAASVGDGKRDIKIPLKPPASDYSLILPKIRLGDIHLKGKIMNGKLELSPVTIKSPDVEIKVSGFVELRDPYPFSNLMLTFQVRLESSFLNAHPDLKMKYEAMATAQKELFLTDGSLSFALSGPLKSPISKPAAASHESK